MVSSSRHAIACILVIFSTVVLAHAQTTPVKEATATINGKVTIKGKGVPGVVVHIRSNDLMTNESRSPQKLIANRAVTDADGEYRIVNIPPGNYVVSPITPTLVTADSWEGERSLILNKGETIEHFDFRMVPGGVITGKVVDSDGRPIIEEQVYVFVLPSNESAYLRLGAMTDDRGVYRLFGLRPGSYRVAAGRDENAFSPRYGGGFARTFHPAVTDPSQATVVEVSEGSEATGIDITFSRTVTTYTVSGRIVDAETGRPMPNIGYGITRHYDHGSSTMGTGATSNSRGEFKIENVTPGKYSVSLSSGPDSDWRVEESRFEITDQDVTGLVIKTIKSASVSGVVVVEGTDDKAAREELGKLTLSAWISSEPGQRSPSPSTTVNPDGTFQLRGLASGITSFYLHSPRGLRLTRVERDGVIQPRGIEIRERENVTGIRLVVTSGNASLRGTIELENGSRPPDGRFYIWLKRIDEDPNSLTSGSYVREQLDERGRFQFTGLVPGAYEVNAGMYLVNSRKAYVAKKQQVVVTSGTTSNITVTVDLSSQPTTIKQ